MARPKKYNLDTDQIKKLASLGCTNKEIADFFGCSADLLEKSYSEFLTKGRAEQKLRLRQLQWKSAEKGNIVMQIWLGKQILGQSENTIKEDDEPLAWSIE
jgi:hypothetical protein|tara:strand:+ start:366 stop:668 length:303 start_codon:yes stop_codon:yes gene_type:complete